MWENLHYTYTQQLKRKFLTLGISILILAVSFGVIFGLKYLNYKTKKAYKKPTQEIIDPTGKVTYYVPPLEKNEAIVLILVSVAIAIVSKIVNKIFTKLMVKLTQLEKRYNISQFNASCVKKTVAVGRRDKGAVRQHESADSHRPLRAER